MTVLTAAAAAAAAVGLTAPMAHADGYGDTKITKVVVNGGKPVVVDATSAKSFTASVTATDNSGIKGMDTFRLVGPEVAFANPSGPVKCVKQNATTSTCTAKFIIDPRADFYDNSPAGNWYVDAWVQANDEDFYASEKAGSFKVQRATKATPADATPEPVKKGKDITVTGKLTRADWTDHKFLGLKDQQVKLQFMKKGGTAYADVKTVKSGNGGALKATVKATVDGYFRYVYAGNATTAPVTSGADLIDVR
ncbi:calcium-binding protein [Streptomyces sp. MST-110588]|nr:calcium-binding protein [Streptomyces sp. MST-110588]